MDEEAVKSSEPAGPSPDNVPTATGVALEPEVPGLLSDCRLMLSFARKNAFIVPATLMREIAWLDSVLKRSGIGPLSSISSQLVSSIDANDVKPRYRVPATVRSHGSTVAGDAAGPADASDGLSPEEVILDVHAQLSTLISPTTALSLQTSEPPPGKTRIFGGMPPLVTRVILVAVFSAVVFVVSALMIGHNAAKPDSTAAQASNAAVDASAPASAPSQVARAPSASAGTASGVKP